MPTVFDVLKQSGFSDRDIQELDGRAISAFGNVLSAAEDIGRANTQFYEEKIMPGLVEWGTEKDGIIAEKVAAERRAKYFEAAAREAGILPNDPVNTYQGTPGNPTYSGGNFNDFAARAGQALGTLADVQWKYESLYGSKLPMSPSELVRQADAVGTDPLTFADRKFNFAKREQELQAQRQKEYEQKIRDDERSKVMNQYSDGVSGSFNPRSASSGMGTIQREVKAGTRPDPLKLDAAGRRKAALEAIHRHIEERAEREG